MREIRVESIESTELKYKLSEGLADNRPKCAISPPSLAVSARSTRLSNSLPWVGTNAQYLPIKPSWIGTQRLKGDAISACSILISILINVASKSFLQ